MGPRGNCPVEHHPKQGAWRRAAAAGARADYSQEGSDGSVAPNSFVAEQTIWACEERVVLDIRNVLELVVLNIPNV